MSIEKNLKLFLPVTKVWYALVPKRNSEIDSIDENIDGSITVNFAGGSDWKEFYQTIGEAGFNETEKKTDEGPVFNQKLSINNPGDGLENQIKISDLRNMPLIIKMDMPDSNSKIMGTQENPVFLTKKYKNADYVNSSDISFARLAEIPAPYLA